MSKKLEELPRVRAGGPDALLVVAEFVQQDPDVAFLFLLADVGDEFRLSPRPAWRRTLRWT